MPAGQRLSNFGKDLSLAELRMRVHQQDSSLTTILEHSRARTLSSSTFERVAAAAKRGYSSMRP